MTKASDNPFPSVLVVEGSAPASPAAGDQRLFIDSADHKLKRVNSSGTVTTVEGGGGGSLELTDGTTDLTAVTKITGTGLVVGGSSAAATLQGHLVQLAKTVLSSSAASITFSSIPSGYSSLLLVLQCRVTATTDQSIGATFNSDTTSGHYQYQYRYSSGGSNNVGNSGSTGTALFFGGGPGTGNTANYAGVAILEIPNYAGTTFFKQALARQADFDTSTTTTWFEQTFAGQWLSTSAITAITLTPGSGSFAAGTVAILYGLY